MSAWRPSHCALETAEADAHTSKRTQTERGAKTTGGSERESEKKKKRRGVGAGGRNTCFNSNLDKPAVCVAPRNYHITTLFITTEKKSTTNTSVAAKEPNPTAPMMNAVLGVT